MTIGNKFLTQLKNFDSETRNAASYAYAYLAIDQAASRSQLLLDRLNDTPTFWLTVSAACQTAAYITLGRIFDNKSPYNVDQLLKAAESNLSLFQRPALAERKREGKGSDPP